MKVVINDGGRRSAGYLGTAGDCVARSIAIAAQLPYQEVYDAICVVNARTPRSKRRMKRGTNLGRHTAAHGIYVQSEVFKKYIRSLGFVWTPTMGIGTGCKVHLRDGELPMGRLIVSLSRHYCAVIDGVIHDIHDPSRGGTRCVYGVWSLPPERWKKAYDCVE